MAKTRKGEQKPVRSLVLPYKTSKYKAAIELYKKTGKKPIKWQELLVKDILSICGGRDKLWKHTKFGYSLPRRNGKNEIVLIRELYGLHEGEKILHTAHRTATSHTAWERLCDALDALKIEYKSYKQFGFENVRLANGGLCNFRTRSSKGGLGEGYDLLVIDEAQEYTDDQASALKYVVSDSKNPQTLMCGTPPTPVSSGTVFTKFRKSTLEDGGNGNSGWAEWSIEDMEDPHNKELWYQTNPSLGTILTERAIQDEIGEDDIDFNIQRLGLWIKYNQKSAISKVEWEELKLEKLPKLAGRLHAGIKFGYDGTNVSMSIATKTEDGRIFGECIDCRNVRVGTQWILDFIKKAKIDDVAIDGANGQQILEKEFKDAKLKAPILPTVKEIIAANATFEKGLYGKKICHMGQQSLVQVVSNCEKRNIGANGGFGYRALVEGMEIGLMDSFILAVWLAENEKEKTKQIIGY